MLSICSTTSLCCFGYPIAPVVFGLILRPIAERQRRHALAISNGDQNIILMHSSIVVILLLLIVIAVLLLLYIEDVRTRKKVLSQIDAN